MKPEPLKAKPKPSPHITIGWWRGWSNILDREQIAQVLQPERLVYQQTQRQHQSWSHLSSLSTPKTSSCRARTAHARPALTQCRSKQAEWSRSVYHSGCGVQRARWSGGSLDADPRLGKPTAIETVMMFGKGKEMMDVLGAKEGDVGRYRLEQSTPVTTRSALNINVIMQFMQTLNTIHLPCILSGFLHYLFHIPTWPCNVRNEFRRPGYHRWMA